MSSEKVQYKDYGRYRVYATGLVVRKAFRDPMGRLWKEKPCKVSLFKSAATVRFQEKQVSLPRLVFESFVRSVSSNERILCINGDRMDCRLSNLQVVSVSEHMKSIRPATPAKGKTTKPKTFKKTERMPYAQIIVNRILEKRTLTRETIKAWQQKGIPVRYMRYINL